MLLVIAWRNIWRNRRRTLIAAGAVFMALLLVIFTLSMKFGSLDQIVQAGVNQVGDIQVHDTGYEANQSIDRAFFYNKQIGQKIQSVQGVKYAIPKLETFSLASFGKKTKGVLLSGVNPDNLNRQLHLSSKIVSGKYLAKSDEVIIGDNLAEFLHINTGDSLVLLGQGYRGVTAFGIYKVAGIFHMPSLQMNSGMVFMNLKTAQNFAYPYQKGLMTSILVYNNNPSQLMQIKNVLQNKLGNHFEIITWKTMLSELVQTSNFSKASTQIIMMILYVIAAFGIFSTILMMTMEKRKQFAVMISIGMQRRKLMEISIAETFLISVLGIVAALLVILPAVFYMHYHPIPVTGDMAKMYLEFNVNPVIQFSIKPFIFISQVSIVFILSILSALYPVIYISKFNILNAFRH